MRKLRGAGPSGELSICIQPLRRDQLDGSLPLAAFGQEYSTLIRSPKPLPQRELLTSDLTCPILPEFCRDSHNARHNRPLFYSSGAFGAKRLRWKTPIVRAKSALKAS